MIISVDSNFSHNVWQEMGLSKMAPNGIPYPMVSGPGGKIGSEYGVYDEANGVDVRGRFLIDSDSIVQVYKVLTTPLGRNVSKVLRQIRALQHHQKTGELMSSG